MVFNKVKKKSKKIIKIETNKKIDNVTLFFEKNSLFIKTKPLISTSKEYLLNSLICASLGKKIDFEIKDVSNDLKSEILNSFIDKNNLINNKSHKNEGEFGLLFSGGADSVAAYHLLDKLPKRIFVDYGGWFQRESDWIDKIGCEVVFLTDIRKNISNDDYERLIDGESDWRFCYFPIFWSHENLNLSHFGTGTVLEATPINNLNGYVPLEFSPLSQYGLSEFSPTKICSEVVTSKICEIEYANQIDMLIKSTAGENSTKMIRKKLLSSIVKHIYLGQEMKPGGGSVSDTLNMMGYADKFLLPFFNFYLNDKMKNFFPEIDLDKIPRFNLEEIKIYGKRLYNFNKDNKFNAIAEEKFDYYNVETFSVEDFNIYKKINEFSLSKEN